MPGIILKTAKRETNHSRTAIRNAVTGAFLGVPSKTRKPSTKKNDKAVAKRA